MFGKRGIFIAVISSIFILFPFKVSTDEQEIMQQINELGNRALALEEKTKEQDKVIEEQQKIIPAQEIQLKNQQQSQAGLGDGLDDSKAAALKSSIGKDFITTFGGIKISCDLTLVAQGTTNANTYPDKDKTKAGYSTKARLTFKKDFKDLGSNIYLRLRTGVGSGINNDLILYSRSNGSMVDGNLVYRRNFSVVKAWYEQRFFKDKAIVTFGKFDPTNYLDNNEIAISTETQFLSSMFANNPAIEFPANSLAVRLGLMPAEFIDIDYVLMSATTDLSDLSDHLWNGLKINIKPNFFNKAGNYRFILWNNQANQINWSNWPDGTQADNTYGFALSFDQAINDSLIAFLRYGWQNPKVYNPDIVSTGGYNFSIGQSWSTGFQLTGNPWSRNNDIFGLAVGQIIPSVDYKDATGRLARNEGHLELYYSICVNKHLFISPDFQYIWNPFGGDAPNNKDSIFVCGLRAYIDF